jgi:hypothetical protein
VHTGESEMAPPRRVFGSPAATFRSAATVAAVLWAVRVGRLQSRTAPTADPSLLPNTPSASHHTRRLLRHPPTAGEGGRRRSSCAYGVAIRVEERRPPARTSRSRATHYHFCTGLWEPDFGIRSGLWEGLWYSVPDLGNPFRSDPSRVSLRSSASFGHSTSSVVSSLFGSASQHRRHPLPPPRCLHHRPALTLLPFVLPSCTTGVAGQLLFPESGPCSQHGSGF